MYFLIETCRQKKKKKDSRLLLENIEMNGE